MAFRNLFSRKQAAEPTPVGRYSRLAMDLEPLTEVMQRLTLPGLKSGQIDDEEVKKAVNTIRFLNEKLLDLSRELHQLKNQNEQLERRIAQAQAAAQARRRSQGSVQRTQPLGHGSGQVQWGQPHAGQNAATGVRSPPNASPDDSRDRDRNRSE